MSMIGIENVSNKDTISFFQKFAEFWKMLCQFKYPEKALKIAVLNIPSYRLWVSSYFLALFILVTIS